MLELNQILHQYSNAEEVCTEMSKQLEQLQSKHFASNRAMHEIFSEDLVVDIRTKKIFKELVELTKKIQCVFLSDAKVSDNGALSASQLLVTINYNYVLKAMTAFPRDTQSRHHLIGKLVTEALKT